MRMVPTSADRKLLIGRVVTDVLPIPAREGAADRT